MDQTTTEMIQQYLRDNPKRKKMRINICTIWPGGKATEDMVYSRAKLKKAANLDPHFVYVEAGAFQHRNDRETADKEQCLIRQKYLDKVPEDEWILVLDADEALFAALDWLAPTLEVMDAMGFTRAMIYEMLPDGMVKLRPRIFKNIEGLEYGTDAGNWKHDWINIHKHVCPGPANNTYGTKGNFCNKYNCTDVNYIDVNDPDIWQLDFITFWHSKNGYGMSILNEEVLDKAGTSKDNLNMLFLRDLEVSS